MRWRTNKLENDHRFRQNTASAGRNIRSCNIHCKENPAKQQEIIQWEHLQKGYKIRNLFKKKCVKISAVVNKNIGKHESIGTISQWKLHVYFETVWLYFYFLTYFKSNFHRTLLPMKELFFSDDTFKGYLLFSTSLNRLWKRLKKSLYI